MPCARYHRTFKPSLIIHLLQLVAGPSPQNPASTQFSLTFWRPDRRRAQQRHPLVLGGPAVAVPVVGQEPSAQAFLPLLREAATISGWLPPPPQGPDPPAARQAAKLTTRPLYSHVAPEARSQSKRRGIWRWQSSTNHRNPSHSYDEDPRHLCGTA